jgi:diguanylate cyclase (GGDEF)-like protein
LNYNDFKWIIIAQNSVAILETEKLNGSMEFYLAHWKDFFFSGLMIAGTLILIASLIATHKIVRRLPKGKVCRNWSVLRVLFAILIAAFISYTAVSWNGRIIDEHGIGYFVVPFIYFLCACLLYLTISFVLDAAIYIKQFASGELENITDPLLGIHNRRYLDLRLQQEVQRSLRYNLPLSILLLCLDDFKRIVETHGQEVGNGVLISLGKVLLNKSRVTDIIARFGEEKIMIIATNTPVSSIPVFAERLRKAIPDAIQLPKDEVAEFTKEKKDNRVTVCIGIAGFGPETNTMESMVKSAEDALSHARAKGPNMVIVNKSGPLD